MKRATGTFHDAPTEGPPHRGIAQLVEQRSPKPRAEGSSPSAPATKPAVFFENGGFSALFRRVGFEQTAGDAQMLLKSSHLLPTILPRSVRYSIKKASLRGAPQVA